MTDSKVSKRISSTVAISGNTQIIVNLSQVVVIALGLIVLVLSLWGLYTPERLIQLVKGVIERNFGIYFAIGIRVVLGVALLVSATDSAFPMAFRALGWIAIFAAVGLAVIGSARMRKFVAWFDRFSPVLVRIWLLFGIAFAGFLIYGVSFGR